MLVIGSAFFPSFYSHNHGLNIRDHEFKTELHRPLWSRELMIRSGGTFFSTRSKFFTPLYHWALGRWGGHKLHRITIFVLLNASVLG